MYWIASPFTPGAMSPFDERTGAHDRAQQFADRFGRPIAVYREPKPTREHVAFTVRPTP